MTDIIGGEAATGTPPGGSAPTAEAGTKAERPEWLGEKFWDGEAGAPRTEQLARSYGDLERLIGSRVGDLSVEARRKLAEALPDTLKETWAGELRAKLGEDPEFLAPLEEAWKGKHLKAAPEAYEVPELGEGRNVDHEHALYGKAVETAKKFGLDQAAFAEMMGLVAEAQDDVRVALSGATEEQWKAAITDLEPRTNAVANRLKSLAPTHAQALLEQVREPNAFLALEEVIKATSAKPLALEGATSPENLSAAQLRQMQRDPRYADPMKRDPAFVDKIQKGWQRLYGETL